VIDPRPLTTMYSTAMLHKSSELEPTAELLHKRKTQRETCFAARRFNREEFDSRQRAWQRTAADVRTAGRLLLQMRVNLGVYRGTCPDLRS